MSSSVKRNIQIIYKEMPTGGVLDPRKAFEIRHGTIDLEKTEVGKGQLLVRTLYISMEPWLGPTLRDPSVKSDFPVATLGVPFSGPVVAEVMKTNNPKFAVGDVISGFGEWAEYGIVGPETELYYITKIQNVRETKFPLSYYLGVFGIPGYAAYCGLKICEPLVPGQTLFVSAATGAIAQIVGQYAKSQGLRVVGSAGNDEKVDYLLNDLGFDAAFNYNKHNADYNAILKETCPKGIDIYFETYGGKILDAVLKNCNYKARIALCGMISQYHRENDTEPIHNIMQAILKSIRIEGFMTNESGAECVNIYSKLIEQGKMFVQEEISDGIETLLEAFTRMLERKNRGKPIIHVADL